MADPEIKKLGKYEILAELGKGAMGVVYKGWDPFIERLVAIKTIRLDQFTDDADSTEIARFKREAQAAGRITHPNIVAVYEYNEENNVSFIAMEFIEGRSLKQHFDDENRFKLPDIVSVMEELLNALDFAHKKGVVHRDIKPANIMLTVDGKVKIADFGIARIESSTMTQQGAVLGTPSYMSPEQLMGQTVDGRSDIYSSGMVLYQFLTGDKPFTGSLTSIMHKVLHTIPEPPSALNIALPSSLDQVVLKAIAKRPQDRFQTAAEFAVALKKAANGEPWETSSGKDQIAEDDSDATIMAGADDMPRRAELRASAEPLPPPLQSQPQSQLVVAPPTRQSGGKTAIIVGILVVVLGIAGGAVYYVKSGGGEQNISLPSGPDGSNVTALKPMDTPPTPLSPPPEVVATKDIPALPVPEAPTLPSPPPAPASVTVTAPPSIKEAVESIPLPVERAATPSASPKRPKLLGELTTNKGASPIFATGDTMKISVGMAGDGYLYCFYQQYDGSVLRLFPNRYHRDAFTAAGSLVSLPGSGMNFRLTFDTPGITEIVRCFASPTSIETSLPKEITSKDLEPLAIDLPTITAAFSQASSGAADERSFTLKVR